MRRVIWAIVAGAILGTAVERANAAEYRWVGMRHPCKQSGVDGLDSSQLDKKIGVFITLPDASAWVQTITNVHSKFPHAKPWVTWAVSPVRDAQPMSDADHEEHLKHFDEQGIDVFLELAPNRDDDVPAMIEQGVAKFGNRPCVKGVGVDLEFYKRIDDATAQAWDASVKKLKPDYRLFFKHWDQAFMPPNYRGKGDLIFINTSSEATVDVLNNEFAEWAKHFAPSAVAFQIGYPSDEDGMDGDKTKGWAVLKDPIKEWGDSLLEQIGETNQDIGLLWVCAKSGKTYNANWDLTKAPAEAPAR